MLDALVDAQSMFCSLFETNGPNFTFIEKKKKTSGRPEFQKKKLEMFTAAREQVGDITRQTLTFMYADLFAYVHTLNCKQKRNKGVR